MEPNKPTPYAYAPTKSGGKFQHSLGQGIRDDSVAHPPDCPESDSDDSSLSSGGPQYHVPDLVDSDEETHLAGELFRRVRASTPVKNVPPPDQHADVEQLERGERAEPTDCRRCKCGKCVNMPLAIEQKCCSKENLAATHLEDFVPGTGECVLSSPTIQHVLSKLSVQCAWLMQRKYQGYKDEALNFANMTNREYRYHAYRSYTLYMNAVLGKYNRKVVPACVVGHIRHVWPAEDNNYVGFIDVDENGTPIHNDELAEL